MIVDVTGHPAERKIVVGRDPASSDPTGLPGARAGGATTDEMSECSFPASDPPSVWTWEVRAPTGASAAPKNS
jgi:hypothetical protein